MPVYEVVHTQRKHIDDMAPRMRKADVAEVWAAGHYSPEEALHVSVLASRDTMAGLVDGRTVCIFGVAAPTLLSEVAYPWMLTATELPKYAKTFLQGSRRYVELLRWQYPILRNYVDARNTAAINWLRWLGFVVQSPVPHGVEQLPFHPFEMRTK